VQAQGRLDRRPVDARGPGPVEVRYRREPPDPRARQTTFEAAAGAFLLFRGHAVFEQLNGAPPPFRGPGAEIGAMGCGVVRAAHRPQTGRSPGVPAFGTRRWTITRRCAKTKTLNRVVPVIRPEGPGYADSGPSPFPSPSAGTVYRSLIKRATWLGTTSFRAV